MAYRALSVDPTFARADYSKKDPDKKANPETPQSFPRPTKFVT